MSTEEARESIEWYLGIKGEDPGRVLRELHPSEWSQLATQLAEEHAEWLEAAGFELDWANLEAADKRWRSALDPEQALEDRATARQLSKDLRLSERLSARRVRAEAQRTEIMRGMFAILDRHQPQGGELALGGGTTPALQRTSSRGGRPRGGRSSRPRRSGNSSSADDGPGESAPSSDYERSGEIFGRVMVVAIVVVDRGAHDAGSDR